MRSRVLLLAVVIIGCVSLIPAAAQTTECTIGFVNGLLQMSGECGLVPHHLQPLPTVGPIEPTPDRNLNAKRNAKQKKQRQRQHAQNATQQAREDTRRANERATATATTLAGQETTTAGAEAAQQTATASAESFQQTATAIVQQTAVSLTATAEARDNPRDETNRGQANADNDQADAVLVQAAEEEPLDGPVPTPTAKEARRIQRVESRERDRQRERREKRRERDERKQTAQVEERSGIFSPTPIPQLSPEPPFVNH